MLPHSIILYLAFTFNLVNLHVVAGFYPCSSLRVISFLSFFHICLGILFLPECSLDSMIFLLIVCTKSANQGAGYLRADRIRAVCIC